MAVRNPNGPEGYITTFKDLGSMIAVYDEINSGNDNLKTKLVASIEQQDYDYGTVKSLSTYINNMVSASSNMDTAKTNLISATSNYLTTVTAVDINTTATTASGVLASLKFAMEGATDGGITPSGVRVLLSGHFHNYGRIEYDVYLPVTSGAVYLSQAESMALISGTLPATQRQIDDTYGD
ncbi:MAG: hypothetical protein CMB80_10990 [Flammeovirgaceae bacterium]|nr:hypothetical protein [Flammeovirgaceae bacterium]